MARAPAAPSDPRALRRAAWIVFFAALAIRGIYLLAVYDGPASLREPDSAVYEGLAGTLLETGRFVTRTGHDYAPETERMPGYVVYLAAVRAAFGEGPLFPALGQIALDALTCLAVGWMAMTFNRRLFLPAGLLAAANVNLVAHSVLVLTDSLFLLGFAVLLALTTRYLLAVDRHQRSLARVAGIGLVLGLVLLVRPVVVLMPPLFLVAFVAVDRADGRNWRRTLVACTLFLSCVAILAAPLLWRNVRDFGHLGFTSQTGDHALFFVFPAVRDLGQGQGFDAARQEAARKFAAATGDNPADGGPADDNGAVEGRFRHCPSLSDPFACSRFKGALARDLLKQAGIGAMARAWIAGSVINVFAPAAIAVPAINRMDRPRFYSTAGETALGKLRNFLVDQRSRLFLLIVVPAAVLTAILRILQVLGAIALIADDSRRRWTAFFLIAVMGYFLAVTGPVTGVKYRLPLEPILCLFLAYGMMRWNTRLGWLRRGPRNAS